MTKSYNEFFNAGKSKKMSLFMLAEEGTQLAFLT